MHSALEGQTEKLVERTKSLIKNSPRGICQRIYREAGIDSKTLREFVRSNGRQTMLGKAILIERAVKEIERQEVRRLTDLKKQHIWDKWNRTR